MALARAAEAAILVDHEGAAVKAVDELLRLLYDLGTRRWAADALEMAAVVLERRGRHGDAAVALGAAATLREAAGQPGGGTRSVAEEVRRSAARVNATLRPSELAARDGRGRSLSTERSMVEVARAVGDITARASP
jgi:hypothetical protein